MIVAEAIRRSAGGVEVLLLSGACSIANNGNVAVQRRKPVASAPIRAAIAGYRICILDSLSTGARPAVVLLVVTDTQYCRKRQTRLANVLGQASGAQ
jgi:hypothetical protein